MPNRNGEDEQSLMEKWVNEKLGTEPAPKLRKPTVHQVDESVTFHNILCVTLIVFLLMGFFMASGYLPNYSSEPVRVMSALVIGWALGRYKRR